MTVEHRHRPGREAQHHQRRVAHGRGLRAADIVRALHAQRFAEIQVEAAGTVDEQRPAQIAPGDIGGAELRGAEDGGAEIAIGQAGTGEIGIVPDAARSGNFRQIGAAKIAAREIRRVENPAIEHGEAEIPAAQVCLRQAHALIDGGFDTGAEILEYAGEQQALVG